MPISQNDTLKQFVGKLPTHCLSVFDHFVGLALKGLIKSWSHDQGESDINMRLSDLYDNIHTVLGFYKNNFTARTTQE